MVYNVLIGGYSIGLTFKLDEAQSWVRESMFNGTKQIVPARYVKSGA